jgi:hypothetical protein
MPPTSPPPPRRPADARFPSLLLSGVDVISTMVHSRPLARKTRLVLGLMYLESGASKNDEAYDDDEEDVK